MESWDRLLFMTDISTTCAEAIFRVTVLASWKFKNSSERYTFTNGYSIYWPIKILLARWSFSREAVMHVEKCLFSLNENILRQFWLSYYTILPFEFSKNIVKGRKERSINPSSERLWKWWHDFFIKVTFEKGTDIFVVTFYVCLFNSHLSLVYVLPQCLTKWQASLFF